ncbi:MAG: Gfo/Idh/MocA family protein [Desulfovibrio sp.]
MSKISAPKRCLVIGYGSIGSRHSRLLQELGHDVYVLSRNKECPFPRKESLGEYSTESFDLAIIANPTASHSTTLQELKQADIAERILIEKPLFTTHTEGAKALSDISSTDNMYVAYNLRFHPLITRMQELLAGKRLFSVQAYVGQYLPDWRPGRDYRTIYSAHRSQGGGVLRDLSHEPDLMQVLCGPCESLTAIGGTFSNLEIDSDDVYSILMRSSNCPAITVQMNYLDLDVKREIILNADGLSMKADFIACTLKIGNSESVTIEEHPIDRDFTYREQLIDVLENCSRVCPLNEGMACMQVIESAEEAAAKSAWLSIDSQAR